MGYIKQVQTANIMDSCVSEVWKSWPFCFLVNLFDQTKQGPGLSLTFGISSL